MHHYIIYKCRNCGSLVGISVESPASCTSDTVNHTCGKYEGSNIIGFCDRSGFISVNCFLTPQDFDQMKREFNQ